VKLFSPLRRKKVPACRTEGRRNLGRYPDRTSVTADGPGPRRKGMVAQRIKEFSGKNLIGMGKGTHVEAGRNLQNTVREKKKKKQ